MAQARHLRLVRALAPASPPAAAPEALGLAASTAAAVASGALGAAGLLSAARVWSGPWNEVAHATAGLALAPALVLTLVALHARADSGQTAWSLGAVAFGVLYAALACPVYVAQLALVIPAELVDRSAAPLPHAALAALESFAFAMAGLGCVLLGAGLRRELGWLRRLAVLAGVLAPMLSLLQVFPALFPLALIWALVVPSWLFALARSFAIAP